MLVETPSLLITDDDPGFRETLRVVFEPKGFRTLLASDGEEALKIVHSETVHVVLLDMHMPRLTGLETLRHVEGVSGNVAMHSALGAIGRTDGRAGPACTRVLGPFKDGYRGTDYRRRSAGDATHLRLARMTRSARGWGAGERCLTAYRGSAGLFDTLDDFQPRMARTTWPLKSWLPAPVDSSGRTWSPHWRPGATRSHAWCGRPQRWTRCRRWGRGWSSAM